MSTPVSEDTKARGVVYVVIESEWSSGDVAGCLLRDSGEMAWGHMSSSRNWLQRDLTNGFGDRRTQLEAWYPNGYDVVIVDDDGQIPEDVVERNRLWGEAETKSSASSAEVSE